MPDHVTSILPPRVATEGDENCLRDGDMENIMADLLAESEQYKEDGKSAKLLKITDQILQKMIGKVARPFCWEYSDKDTITFVFADQCHIILTVQIDQITTTSDGEHSQTYIGVNEVDKMIEHMISQNSSVKTG